MNRHLRSRAVGPVLALLVGATLLAAGCSRKPQPEENAAPPPVVDVTAVPLVRGDMEETIAVEGITEAVRTEKIVSPVSGTVIVVRGVEGMAVDAGDTLAIIRSRESEAAIEGARVLLERAATEAQREEARRSYHLAVAAQSVAGVRSTTDGIIATRNVNKGELVAEGAELFTVTDLSSIRFTASVPLRDLPRVRLGEPCRIRFASVPDVVLGGTVQAIEPSADPRNQSVGVHIAFAALGPRQRSIMKTDVFGTARIVTGVRRGVLLVPLPALLRDDETNETSLAVITPDSLAVTVPVTAGFSTDSLVEVSGPGLREGELVIVEGNYGLPDSTRVRAAVTEKP
jgi:membrane fusion protein (multidrug efflux system)